MDAGKPLREYYVSLDELSAKVSILKYPAEFVPTYKVIFPKVEAATEAVLDSIRERLIVEIAISTEETLTQEQAERLKESFFKRSLELIREAFGSMEETDAKILAEILVNKSLGLGPLEILLKDENLEEIVVNGCKEPVWVYHRKLGWLKTNIIIQTEAEIYNYAASIGRKIGVQITNLSPLMDAYLTTGDRTNATLFPISSRGHTLTIRRFARKPWTITDFILSKTITSEAAAFLWLAIQYEMNVLIVGGTASGKTSLLNVLTNFISPSHRIVSIEDTRELQLPEFLHWVPLTTRSPNSEGKGQVTMLDLMVNSLRMRPDRILVGEIRRSREAEVLFEAIHTGHSVYSTLHANTAQEAVKRLTNPPISIPVSMLGALDLVAVMHRDRRREIRRVLEIVEIISDVDNAVAELNPVFRWIPTTDQVLSLNKSARVMDELKLYAGMEYDDFVADQRQKVGMLNWMAKKNINDINDVGRLVSEYYMDPEAVMRKAGMKK